MQLDTFSFNLPFQRAAIDEERREVWGWGSTESFATDGRVITYEASKDAFQRWIARGNIREMHQPIAAGRALSWEAHDDTRRVWVGTRVSRGAESTWLKILDGTLQAFSVRGRIDRMEPRTIQRNGKSVTVPHVLAYTIDELSYVDAPSDPGAVFIDIIRGDGVATDVLAEGGIETPEFVQRDAVLDPNTDPHEPNATAIGREVTAEELPDNRVDPEELARAENVTITPIAANESPDGAVQSQASPDITGEKIARAEGAPSGDGENSNSEGTATDPLVERADGVTDLTSAAAELSQADRAGRIIEMLNELIRQEAGEIADGDGDEAVWDVYGLLQARDILRGFQVKEVVEAVVMARKAEEIDTTVTELQTQLAEAIERLNTLQAAHDVVERGENPVITELNEKITKLETDLERYANEPLPSRPLARVPVEKLFAGDEQQTLNVPVLERSLEDLAANGPAGVREEAQALRAKVALHEVYARGPQGMSRS